MKRWIKRGLLVAVLIIGTVLQLSAQSEVTVWMNSGAIQTYYLTENDRMYFEDNEKLVIEIGLYAKETHTIPLDDIRKITCSELDGTVEDSNQPLAIFPNPVHETLTFRNLNSKETIHIYAIDGRLVKTVEAVGNQPIDISDLGIGLFLVKTQSCTLKMIKL